MKHFLVLETNAWLTGGTFYPIIGEHKAFHSNGYDGGYIVDGYEVIDRNGDNYTAEIRYDNGMIVDDEVDTNLLYFKFKNNIQKYYENNFASVTQKLCDKSPHLKDVKREFYRYGDRFWRMVNNGFTLQELVDGRESFTKEQLNFIIDEMPSSWQRATLVDFRDNKFGVTDHIICDNRPSIYRDGGSKKWTVLNPKSCGFTNVYQDNSIAAKRNNAAGQYFGCGKSGTLTPIKVENITFKER